MIRECCIGDTQGKYRSTCPGRREHFPQEIPQNATKTDTRPFPWTVWPAQYYFSDSQIMKWILRRKTPNHVGRMGCSIMVTPIKRHWWQVCKFCRGGRQQRKIKEGGAVLLPVPWALTVVLKTAWCFPASQALRDTLSCSGQVSQSLSANITIYTPPSE